MSDIRYWEWGSVVFVLTFAAGLMGYPASLIYRYLIDKVTLANHELPVKYFSFMG